MQEPPVEQEWWGSISSRAGVGGPKQEEKRHSTLVQHEVKVHRLLNTKGVMGSAWDISVLVQLQHVLSNFLNKLWSSKYEPCCFRKRVAFFSC